MTVDSTRMPIFSIGPDAPEGAMTVGPNGEPCLTNYGLGIIMADLAKSEGMTLPQAIVSVSGGVANVFAQYLENGQNDAQARKNADAVLASAKMRLEELYRGNGAKGGAA